MLIDVFRGVIKQKLANVGYGVAVAAILYGAAASRQLLLLVFLFFCVRLLVIATELSRKRMTEMDWEQRHQRLLSEFSELTREALELKCAEYGLGPGATARRLARACVEAERAIHRQPRSAASAAAEILGMLSLLLLLPATIAFYTHDFVDYRGAQDWRGLLLTGLCAIGYAWPLKTRPGPRQENYSIRWWTLASALVIPSFVYGLLRLHPYLDPRAPTALRADKVLALSDNVTAGRYADWVFGHAHTLDAAGQREAAIEYFRRGLRLAPHDHVAQRQLARLEGSAAAFTFAPHAPYWTSDSLVALPDCSLDASLSRFDSVTLVIVRAGQVDEQLIRRVGDVLTRELQISVCIASEKLLLPDHGRTRGIVVGRQWDVATLGGNLLALLDPPPAGPLKYLVLTEVDIYSGGANYLFSASFDFGAIVSSARFAQMSDTALMLQTRVAKQALGAVIKSFGVAASDDPNCVTSYSNGPEEFDEKGNRPVAATRAAFARAVAEMNSAWKNR